VKRYAHIDFSPPQGAREAARRALEVRAEKPPSQRGMTPVGLARARDLANGKSLSPETVRRMKAYFDRHQVDKRGSTWDEQGKGWQAWQGWGGDAGYAWARKVVRQMDAADEKAATMSDVTTTTMADAEVSVVPFQAYPFADGSWDADAAVGRLRAWSGVDAETPSSAAWTKYAEGFAIVRGPRDNLTSYILPHHDVRDGELVTVPAGVSAAIGALHGARGGGVDVPADVRDAALSHLEKHRAAWEQSRASRCPSVAITMAAEPVSRSAIQIARPGDFKGHPQGGFVMDGETFAGIIRNFESSRNRRVPVDYEHATEMVSAPGVLQHGAPAVGWVTSLEVRGDDLWATVEWCDPAAVEAIRSGRYAYCSPAIVFGAIDPESGESIGARLTSVALTNRPFLDGMEPVTARDPRASSLSPESVHIPAAVKVERTPKMEDEKKMGESKAMTKLRSMGATYCNLDGQAEEMAILEAIEKMLEKLEMLEMAESAAMSDRVIAEGRAPATARDRLVKLCRADRATFEALYPAQAAPAADARLMSTRVSPQGGMPVERAPQVVRHADAAADRAAKLMSAAPSLSYKDALLQASRELREEALAPLNAILGGLK
jgi:phage I-like protein